jgi:hypothetical protein
MVAAALEVAHAEVISKLPEYSTHTPIGWKFMDKFVQLPIVIPPFREQEISTESGADRTMDYTFPKVALINKMAVLESWRESNP